MRAVECPCGTTLTGADDPDLIRLGRVHADEHHPTDNITDDFIRDHVAKNAYEVGAEVQSQSAG